MNKKKIEKAFENPIWKITKYKSKEDKEKDNSFEKVEFKGNVLCNEGINEILTIIGSSASGTKYDNTNAYLIVGTGNGAASASNTESTFTAGVKEAMEDGYPTYGTDQKITWKSSFDGDTANQEWQEFGVLNAETDGDLLNRKVEDEGTKTSGQVWDLELSITFS
jgi:hypothetical protein